MTYYGLTVFEWMLLGGGGTLGYLVGIRRAERGRARHDMRRVWQGRSIWRSRS